MPNMKTEINHNLLTQTIKNINHTDYSEKTVQLITRFIEDLRNNTTEKGTRFEQIYFLHKRLNGFDQKGVMR